MIAKKQIDRIRKNETVAKEFIKELFIQSVDQYNFDELIDFFETNKDVLEEFNKYMESLNENSKFN